MAKAKITYNDAVKEIEEILEKFDTEQLDVDALASEVKRATELIALCKEKLLKAEKDVSDIINKED